MPDKKRETATFSKIQNRTPLEEIESTIRELECSPEQRENIINLYKGIISDLEDILSKGGLVLYSEAKVLHLSTEKLPGWIISKLNHIPIFSRHKFDEIPDTVKAQLNENSRPKLIIVRPGAYSSVVSLRDGKVFYDQATFESLVNSFRERIKREYVELEVNNIPGIPRPHDLIENLLYNTALKLSNSQSEM